MYTIIGADGFIGSYLAAALKASGAQLYIPARGDVDMFSRDLGRVFYCAGLTNDYAQRPFDTVEAHVSLLSRILQKTKFDHLVYLSSTRLYDGQTLKIAKEDSDLSVNPANPRHLYDLSKIMGENLCMTVAGGRTATARLSSVYADGPKATGFLSGLLQRLPKETKFDLDSKSGMVRDYIHVGDVVKGLTALSDSKKTGIFNFAGGENVSNRDIVDTLNAGGCQITLKTESRPETAPVCDITKLRGLGVDPVPVLTYLRNFMQEQKKNGTR